MPRRLQPALLAACLAAGCTDGGRPPDHLASPATGVSPPPAPAPGPRVSPGRGKLLIIHAGHLADAARAWARHRAAGGWEVETLAAAPGGDEATRRETLRRRIRGGGATAVLLLGRPPDVPTWKVPQRDPTLRDGDDPLYATDHPYQVGGDGSGAPAVALGRIPARTAAEALVVLDKIRAYERADNLGPWRRHVAYAAGEGRFGLADHLLEGLVRTMIAQAVPPDYDISMTYAKASSIYCPPPSRLTETVLGQLGGGALLFNYMGHGTATGLDHLAWNGRALAILDVRDVRRLEAVPGAHAVALLTCCSAGWYDGPADRPSLAEAMLFHPAGPVAVIAGSRPTHPYANTILQKEVTRLLLVERVETAGELDLRAMQEMLVVDDEDLQLDALAAPVAAAMEWPTGLEGLRRMHVELYNLLGDPALRLALPGQRVQGLALDGTRLSGRVEGMAGGAVVVTVESRRTRPARRDELVAVLGETDPDLEAKAAHNYPIANDLVLARHEAMVTGDRFDVELGELPAAAAVVKVYAAGRDVAGRPMDAAGAIIPTPPAAPADR